MTEFMFPTNQPVPLAEIIAAVQDQGYLVIDRSELPEVTENGEGRPGLPVGYSDHSRHESKANAFRAEAYGKWALAEWWDKQEARVDRRRAAMVSDLRGILGFTTERAESAAGQFMDAGWKR